MRDDLLESTKQSCYNRKDEGQMLDAGVNSWIGQSYSTIGSGSNRSDREKIRQQSYAHQQNVWSTDDFMAFGAQSDCHQGGTKLCESKFSFGQSDRLSNFFKVFHVVTNANAYSVSIIWFCVFFRQTEIRLCLVFLKPALLPCLPWWQWGRGNPLTFVTLLARQVKLPGGHLCNKCWSHFDNACHLGKMA
jgi:hypothetical protein